MRHVGNLAVVLARLYLSIGKMKMLMSLNIIQVAIRTISKRRSR